MADMISISRDELTKMEDRLKTLAKEKSNLQLITHLIDQLSAIPGLEGTIDNMLMIVLDNLGGSNIIIYYIVDYKYYYADVLGKKAQFDSIDDPLVQKVFETHQFVEYEHDFSDTMMMTPEFTRAFTWAFPLLVGKDIIGVLKMENMHVSSFELQEHLQTFFNYIALLLKNEILGYTSLSKAYDLLRLVNIDLLKEISERQQAEEQLLKSEERYRTIFENTGTGMVVIEEDITMSLVNTEAEKLFGYSRQELEGMKKWSEFVAKEDLERMEEDHRLRIIDPSSVPTVYEFNLINRQGSVRNIAMFVAIIPGTKKSVVSLLDITKRKEAETGLQEANQKLANWVSELEERTAEMSQLIEMGEQLQSCQSIEEACTISAQYVQKLFPASQGALYLLNTSRDLAEAVKMWGDSASTEKVFMPLNCWAVRRGRPHLVDDSHPGLLCGHITGPQAGQYLCVPLMANSETMGVLSLNHTAPEQEQQKSTDRLSSDHKTQLILALGENIALAIVNLRLRETLRQQATRDILTGLFNRRYMEESLARELCRAEREKKPVGVIMFDIDNFKDFNDLFGHAGGDALLRELGIFLNNHTRGSDIVSRYGGEEFVAVLPGATLEQTRLRAEELRQGVKELQVYHLGKPLGKITISFGVAVFPEHGLTSDEILKSADTALYRAKNEGRDRVVVASTIG